jgi:NADH dehydrogenase FAD-containing subunit
VVVGAGVVGIELAGEISSQYKHKSITLICSTDTLLPDQNPTLSDSLKNQLAQRNVKIIYGSKANIAQLGITKTGKLDKRSKIGLTRSDGGESSEEVEGECLPTASFFFFFQPTYGPK